VADEDPLTPGEIRRSLKRLEGEDRSLAERITRVAAEMLPVKLWDSEHRALGDKLARHEKAAEDDRRRLEKAIEDLREDMKDLRDEQEKHSEVTWQKVLGLVVALATIAGVIVTLMGQSKGIH
jgi:predicted anti-sigma-YlaC factor YlaD